MAKLDRVYTDFHPVTIKETTGDETDELFRIEDKTGKTVFSKRKSDNDFNVMSYGAKGDDSHDDSDAIIAAINAASRTGVDAGRVVFPWPKVAYKITKPLPLGFAPGLVIEGESPTTLIKQYTNNTPIFLIDQHLMHSWEIKNFNFSYNSLQSASNTAACPIYFSGPSVGPDESEIFNFKLTNLLFNRGYYGVGSDGTKRHTVWGLWGTNLFFGGELTGGAVSLLSAYTSGRPNIHLTNIYVLAYLMNGPLFNIPAAESSSMDAVEVNQVSLSPTIIKEWSGGSWSIGSFKVEGGTYDTGGNPMFDLGPGDFSFDDLRLETLTINASTWLMPYLFRDASGSNSRVRIRSLTLDASITGGSVYVANWGGSGLSSQMVIGNIPSFPTNCYLINNGSTPTSANICVEDWNRGRISADKGNADYTVVRGDTNILCFETALTAQRDVTLPGSFTNNLFDGLKYRIVRSAGGAFALRIIDAQGPTLLDTIPSGKTGVIEYTYRRFGWVQTMKALI